MAYSNETAGAFREMAAASVSRTQLNLATGDVARSVLAVQVVEAHTAGDTLTTAETGSIHTNTGASGAIAIALPAATVGLAYTFIIGAAQELRIDPNGTETISLPSTGVAGAAGKWLVADAIGESVQLVCGIAGKWQVIGYTGTWTAEA